MESKSVKSDCARHVERHCLYFERPARTESARENLAVTIFGRVNSKAFAAAPFNRLIVFQNNIEGTTQVEGGNSPPDLRGQRPRALGL